MPIPVDSACLSFCWGLCASQDVPEGEVSPIVPNAGTSDEDEEQLGRPMSMWHQCHRQLQRQE